QRLDDAWNVFQLAAFVKLLEDPNPPTGGTAMVDAPEPDQPQTPTPCNPPNALVHSRPYTERSQTSQTGGPLLNVPLPPLRSKHRDVQPNIQRARPRHAPVAVAPSSGPRGGEIIVAFSNVERRRRSLRHNCSPIKMMELATALGRLSALLVKAGRIREALDASQESAELYRTLAHGEH
ncbi:hypothetical protein FRC11_000656, partial [Ceratobasidium sp. 423]